MILWTIQPEEIFELINRTGVYRCDGRKKNMRYYREQYLWLADQMRKRIGPPPEGVRYPVWAYQRWSKERLKPDLRAIRWFWGGTNSTFYRLEIDIPNEQVLLSDYWAWSVMLNNGLLSDNEEEDNELDKFYASLSPEAQKEMLFTNWERVFDVALTNNEWNGQGEIVQATFWELRKEQIRKVTMFKTEYRGR